MKEHLVKHPSIVLIIGRRRFGKSALGNYILETFHTTRNIPAYIVSFPKEKRDLLPDWITPVETFDEIPENSVCLIDEGSLKYHALLWNQKETVVMDRMISVSGQKKQTIIFITHTMRKFAVTLLLEVDLLLCKQPSLLHSKLERSEVRKLTQKIYLEFKKLPKDQIKQSYYVVSDEFEGFLRNPLPTFWSEELSEAYAGISINEEKQEEIEETVMLPNRIDSGLKLWFSKKNLKKVLHVLSRNSSIDGELSEMGVQCADGKCYYTFDIRKGRDDKYYLSSDKFDLEASIKEFEEKEISVLVDTESCNVEGIDVVLKPETKMKEGKKDMIEEYAKNIKL